MKKQEELFQEQEEDVEDSSPSPITRIGFVVVTLIVLFGFLIYALIAPIQGVVQGRFASTTLTDNSLELADYTLVFSSDVQQQLIELFTHNQINLSQETSVCLMGEKNENTYYLTDIYHPTIYKQDLFHVSFSSCPSQTLVMLHTHPFERCKASPTDQETLAKIQEKNEDTIMVIMCSDKRFSVYT